jgi:hypothetical protein
LVVDGIHPVRLGYQPPASSFFPQNKPFINNQLAVLFSHNKSTPATRQHLSARLGEEEEQVWSNDGRGWLWALASDESMAGVGRGRSPSTTGGGVDRRQAVVEAGNRLSPTISSISSG